MKIIFGLGNPSTKYNFTRHNFGFLTLDFYAKIHKLTWRESPKFHALTATVPQSETRPDKLLLVKPQTFYNEVGSSALALAHFYKLRPQDFLVVCDDFNLDFGRLRFREHGSAGGNRGLESLLSTFGDENLPRLRLGTANDPVRRQLGDSDFVLSRFTPEERAALPEILLAATNFIDQQITTASPKTS